MPPSYPAGRSGRSPCGRPGTDVPRCASRATRGTGSPAPPPRAPACGGRPSIPPDRCAGRSSRPKASGWAGWLRNRISRGGALFVQGAGGGGGGGGGAPGPRTAPPPPPPLLFSSTDLIQVLEPHQHISRLATIRGPQNPRQLQLIDDPRRAAVADAHAPL